MSHEAHSDSHYIKIYGVLVVLFVISVVGPELGNKYITLITAFGVAFVKAFLVMSEFMHLKIEKKIIGYLFAISIFLMGVFFAGTAPDILKKEGQNWENCSFNSTCETDQRLQWKQPSKPAAHH